MFSVEEIRENYKKLTDSQIEKIASEESKTLRREVLTVLKDEIELRKLNPSLINWVDAENDQFTDFEKTVLIKKIELLDCPNCGEKNTKLSGYEYITTVSMVIVCRKKINKKILCANCARSKKVHSFILTLLTGWWSGPGLLQTPYTLIKEIINSFYTKKIHERVLNDFLHENNGMLRLHGKDEKSLHAIVKKYNE